MAIALRLRLMAPVRHRRAGAYYLRQPVPRFSSEPPPVRPGACWPTPSECQAAHLAPAVHGNEPYRAPDRLILPISFRNSSGCSSACRYIGCANVV